jgi:hypothetical protein
MIKLTAMQEITPPTSGRIRTRKDDGLQVVLLPARLLEFGNCIDGPADGLLHCLVELLPAIHRGAVIAFFPTMGVTSDSTGALNLVRYEQNLVRNKDFD